MTLSASGFAPGASLQISVDRPDGGVEHYPLTAGSDGSASYTFTNTGQAPPLGTYHVTVTDLATGASGSASVTVEPYNASTGSSTNGSTATSSGTSTGGTVT